MPQDHITRLSRQGVLRAAMRMLLVGLLVGTASGCQIVIGVLMLFQGLPMLDADFEKATGHSLTEKGKKVIVLCTSPEKAKMEVTSLDVDIIAEVSRRLKAQEIELVDPNKVATYIDDNGGEVNESEIKEISKKFKADYVIFIELTDFGCQEANSPGLLRGHAQGRINVITYEKHDDINLTKQIYNKPFDSKYPVHQPVSIEQTSLPVFRKQYLDRVSEEIARMFYKHRPGEEF